MPFKSDAQRRFMYAKHPRIAARWSEHTPKGKDLPEHVKKAVVHALEKRAEPPPPEGVSTTDWDRILQQGPKKTLRTIPGGKAEGQPVGKYDKEQLGKGMKVEREHTGDPLRAEEITTDHLEEFPTYYTALENMEKRLSEGKTAGYRLGVRRGIHLVANMQ